MLEAAGSLKFVNSLGVPVSLSASKSSNSALAVITPLVIFFMLRVIVSDAPGLIVTSLRVGEICNPLLASCGVWAKICAGSISSAARAQAMLTSTLFIQFLLCISLFQFYRIVTYKNTRKRLPQYK